MKKINKLKLQQCSIFQKHFMRSVIIPALEDVLKSITEGELKTVEEIKAAGYVLLDSLKEEYK